MMNDLITQTENTSKSSVKRHFLALKKVAKTLMELSDTRIKKLDLPASVTDAIKEARKLKSREAKRRQLQFISKCMRDIDVDDLSRKLEQIDRLSPAQQRQNDALTTLKHKIAEGDEDTLASFIIENPEADRQKIRNLQRQITRETAMNKAPMARQKLFDYLKKVTKASSV
jgi:ribosome-associated protein